MIKEKIFSDKTIFNFENIIYLSRSKTDIQYLEKTLVSLYYVSSISIILPKNDSFGSSSFEMNNQWKFQLKILKKKIEMFNKEFKENSSKYDF